MIMNVVNVANDNRVSEPARLDKIWSSSIAPPDDREIYKWAYEEGELPAGVYAVSGRFDITTAPFLKPVFHALRDRRTRCVTVMTGIQCMKTLVGELWLLWAIVNDSGPTQWVQPDDQEAKEHAEERFNRLLESFPIVHRKYTTNSKEKKITAIHFQHMTLRMEGANNLGNAQRKSVKNQMCSEIHQSKKWKPGHLAEFATRLTQFTTSSKRYIESQPGYAAHLGVDDMHGKFLEGTKEILHFRCLECGLAQPFQYGFEHDDGRRASMVWDDNDMTRRQTDSTDPNLIWNWDELKKTVRYECIKCAHKHYDEPITRRRLLDTCHFPGSFEGETHRSFSWNQLAMPSLGWFHNETGGVRNFLIGKAEAKRGDDRLQRQFYQKVLAIPYDPDRFSHFTKLETITVQTAEADEIEHDGIKFPHRLAAIDVQQDSFWMVVEAWSANGDSITLWGGQLFTWEDCRAMQTKWKVPDQNVCVDQSHRGHEVVIQCTAHGHFETLNARRFWLCWKAMRGSDQPNFIYAVKRGPQAGQKLQLPYTWPPQTGDPCIGLKKGDPKRTLFMGKFCPIFTWSNPWIKDMVIDRRDGRAKSIKHLCASGDWNTEYNSQLHSQKKAYVTGTYGQGKWKWQKFRDDHLFDCKCMCVVRATQLHLIGQGIEIDE